MTHGLAAETLLLTLTSHATRACVAAIVFGSALACPANAGATYLEALAACRAAAAKAQDPTDYPCDWKKIVAGAPGSFLSGKFSFREKGMSGEMTILETGDEPALIGISTVAKSSNSPTCSVALNAARNDKDELVATLDDAEPCEVRIVSVPGPGIVKVTTNAGCSTYCGMGAAFDGKWQLQK